MPAPRRGEFVRLLGEELRAAKADLGRLVTLEAGKIVSEGLGEVQEMIDICDFAVGLSRQLYGLTIATERAGPPHDGDLAPARRLSASSRPSTFPVAVWSWNAALAFVCGDPVVWKPSEKTPLTALAVAGARSSAPLARFGDAPDGLSERARSAGARSARRWSTTTACRSSPPPARPPWAAQVGPRLAARFARAILELGGNNAAIVAPSADLDLALRGVAFAAMGTAGQRCTTLRRLFVHESVYDALVPRLKRGLRRASRSAIRATAARWSAR